MSSELITPQALALELEVTQQTLKNWRKNGRYNLPFVKVGRAVRYRREDVDRFLCDRTISPKASVEE